MDGLGREEWEAIAISFSVVFVITMLCTICACLSQSTERDLEFGHCGNMTPPVVAKKTLPENGQDDKAEQRVQPPQYIGTDDRQKDRAHLKDIGVFK